MIVADRGLLQGKWEVRVNCFRGCEAAGCPLLAKCASNPRFVTCPIGARWFHDFNSDERVHQGRNTILNTLFNKVADDLHGTGNATSLLVTMIAAGTGTAPADLNWTQLQIEGYRTTLVEKQRPAPGKLTAYWFFPPSAGNGTWTEWGLVFNNPTSTPNSGKLLNRWLDTITKTSADTLTGQFSITAANP